MAEKVPRLVAHIDVRQFKLDAMDGFLLTRIDGRLGKKQLAQDTGLPEFQVEKTLEKLERLGVVEIVDPNAPAAAPPPPAAPVRDRTQLPQFASIGLDPKYDPKELEEDVELSPDQKKRVLDMYYRLDDLDHYTLLGVGKDADKKTVKRSYFELASLMHPDRYFKKKLGSFKASPGYDGGRVYVGDLEGKLYAVDAAKGDLLWTFETQGEIHAAPNFVAGDILIGSHDSTLYRLNRDGKKVWEYKIDGPINAAAAIAGDRTFVAGCDSLLHVVDVATGKPLGTVDLGGQAAATGAVEGDAVYVGTMTNQVLAVNWKTLKKSWEFEAKRRQQPFYSSAAVTNDLVVIGGRDKRVYALDRATGKEKWSFVTEGNVDASPVVVGNRVYVGCLSNTGEFYALDLATGKLAQQVTLDSAVGGTVGVGPDCLLVGTDKGTLYKLGAK